MTEFFGKNQIDKVVSSLNAFKTTIYNVNYLNKIIQQNRQKIINAGEYASVIRPIIEKKFAINPSFSIYNISIDKTKWNDGKCYYSAFNSWINKQLNNSKNFEYDEKPISGKNADTYNAYKNIQTFLYNNIDYLNKCLKKNPNGKIFYQFGIEQTGGDIYITIRCIQPDILDETKWIHVSSIVILSEFFPNAIILSTFSQEYIQFVNVVSTIIEELETTNWINNSLIKNIWEYSNISNIANTKCLYSQKYPSWNGILISQCFVPNSNIEIQSNMSELFNDIYFYYPSLTIGELAFSTRNIDGNNILSICKIDTYNGVQCIKEVNIDLEKFFKKNNIIGDTILDGNLNIQDSKGVSVIETDNVTKNISIHGKVGINQDLHEIKGLLDIDNLSNENILTIVDKIAELNNTSYNVVEQVKDTILDNGTFNISPDYRNNVVVLKVPIKVKIEENDISFLHKPSNIFKTNKFSQESFLKIQLIINEINRMSVEINNYYKQEGHKLVMSFVELLNDTEYYYVCSLKAIFKDSYIYFVMSFTLVQNIMVDKSYKQIFTNLINAFSSLNRMLNYSILVIELQEIYNKLIKKDSVNSFTKYVQEGEFSDRFGLVNGEFIFCIQHFSGDILDYNNIGKYLFSEQYPLRNSQFVKDLIIPNTDRTMSDIIFKLLTYYQNNYSLYKTSQNFIIHYLYDNGEKITFLNKIIVKEIEYIIGTGINLFDYIDLNILSTGDNKITGNLYIQDENKTNIFSVDTEYNKITNMYKTGFGTENPKTIIDVNDSGLTDIINIIKDMANKEHILNLNIGFIKNLATINAANVDNCINTQFINVDGKIGSSYQQSKDNYFYCYNSPVNNNPNDYENTYVWLYRNWDNKKFINIDDKNNELIIKNSIDVISNGFKQEYIFDNARTIYTSDWTFGKKFRSRRLFKNNNDNKLYIFGNGINIGNYNLKINNNGNISLFFDYINYMNLYLQNFIIRLNNINIDTIPNYKSVNDYFSIISNVVSPKQFTFKKIVADFLNYKNSKVYDIDFYTQAVSGNNFNKTISQISDINERNKYMLMLINIKSIYSKKNSNPQLFNIGDYGIINSEDDFVDFINLFYCSDVTSNSVTLIYIELQINTIIQPSVDIKGDLRIKGDTYFHSYETNTDFVSIDTADSFAGIGSNERYVNYSNNYLTTTNEDLSRHKFIVSGNTFPISVHERTGEVAPIRDSSGTIISYPENRMSDFSNRTSVTARRKSNYFTIDEMKEYATKYKETALDGPNKGKTISYRYGPDMNFEIKDSTTITREIGNIHMVIDDIVDNNVKAGFGINVVDTSNTGKAIEREILYVSNKSVMDIDKINLGTDVDKINTILLSASSNTLMINNTSLQTIINNEIQKMFTVDSNGKLNIKYGENTYVCEKKI